MFYDILEQKNAFLGYKIFAKGLTHGSGLKLAISQFFLGIIGQENVFYDILEHKKRLSRL